MTGLVPGHGGWNLRQLVTSRLQTMSRKHRLDAARLYRTFKTHPQRPAKSWIHNLPKQLLLMKTWSSKHKSQCRRVHIQSRTVVHTCFKKQQKEKNEAQSSVAPQLTHVKERRKGLLSCSQCLIAKNGCVFL